MTGLLIKNGRIIDPANQVDQVADLYCLDGKIVEIGQKLDLKYVDADSFDAKQKVVAPGFIDIHVHLREPGREDKETIYTASRAAAKGGITSIVAMPNTDPVADDQTVLEYVLSKAAKEAIVNVFVSGAITKGQNGNEIADIWELQKTGAVVVTDDGFDVQNLDVYRKAMQYCKTFKMPMLSHTEDECLAKDGQIHEGVIASRLGLKGIPACAEDVATARIIALVDDVDWMMHFTHVSTKGAVDMIRVAKNKGLKVTADVTPHHFSLTDEAVANFSTDAKMKPPLRSQDHLDALLVGLKDGTIDVIATDHAPHTWTEKHRQFDEAMFGIVGFETMLSLIVTKLVNTGVLTLSEAIAKVTANPARVLGLEKGTLSVGADADIVIFDPEASQTIDKYKFESKGSSSPFHKMTLQGVVTETIVAGKIVVKDGNVIMS